MGRSRAGGFSPARRSGQHPRSLSYPLQTDKVPAFYIKFRNDDLTQFTHGFLRNVALNAKVKATQDAIRVENELREAEAEAKKQVALAQGEAQARIARARGEAEANLLLTRSITPTLLEWKRLEVTAQAVQKWDGKRPMVEGTGSGLLLQLPAAR